MDKQKYLETYNNLGVPLPVFISISLVGILEYRIIISSLYYQLKRDEIEPIDRDTLFLPDIVIDNYPADLPAALRPIFDALWNASGYPGSPSYDAQGNWLRDQNSLSAGIAAKPT